MVPEPIVVEVMMIMVGVDVFAKGCFLHNCGVLVAVRDWTPCDPITEAFLTGLTETCTAAHSTVIITTRRGKFWLWRVVPLRALVAGRF